MAKFTTANLTTVFCNQLNFTKLIPSQSNVSLAVHRSIHSSRSLLKNKECDHSFLYRSEKNPHGYSPFGLRKIFSYDDTAAAADERERGFAILGNQLKDTNYVRDMVEKGTLKVSPHAGYKTPTQIRQARDRHGRHRRKLNYQYTTLKYVLWKRNRGLKA